MSDSLTHLPNRAKFNATIKEYLDEEKPYMLAILDIDYFKRVNDSLGHNVGDQVLIHMANLMRDYFKDECDIFRWGGEEFAVVSNKLTGIQAFEKIDGFRKRVREFDFGLGYTLTVSGGMILTSGKESMNQTVIHADNALYDAKKQGRDKILVSKAVV